MIHSIKQLLLSDIGVKKVVINSPGKPVNMYGDEQQLETANKKILMKIFVNDLI